MTPRPHDPDLDRLASLIDGGFETRSTVCNLCKRAIIRKRSRWELHSIIDAKGSDRLVCPGIPYYGWIDHDALEADQLRYELMDLVGLDGVR